MNTQPTTTHALELIDPDRARKYLGTMTQNRVLRESRVASYARQMADGTWQENGETIKFVADARLVDGQHRLRAIIRSGAGVWTHVIRGLTPRAALTIDMGLTRSVGDSLGYMGLPNGRRLCAAAACVYRYENGQMLTGQRHFPLDMALAVLERHPQLDNFTNDPKSRLMPPSLISAFHYLTALKDGDLADVFIEQVLTGGAAPNSPAGILHNRLVELQTHKARFSDGYIAALFVKAWNHTRAGTTPKQLKFTESGKAVESFPVIA